MHYACFYGYVEIVQELLARDVAVTEKNNWGWTALHIASDCGHLEVVRVLIDYFTLADLFIKSNSGQTALDVATTDDIR